MQSLMPSCLRPAVLAGLNDPDQNPEDARLARSALSTRGRGSPSLDPTGPLILCGVAPVVVAAHAAPRALCTDDISNLLNTDRNDAPLLPPELEPKAGASGGAAAAGGGEAAAGDGRGPAKPRGFLSRRSAPHLLQAPADDDDDDDQCLFDPRRALTYGFKPSSTLARCDTWPPEGARCAAGVRALPRPAADRFGAEHSATGLGPMSKEDIELAKARKEVRCCCCPV